VIRPSDYGINGSWVFSRDRSAALSAIRRPVAGRFPLPGPPSAPREPLGRCERSANDLDQALHGPMNSGRPPPRTATAWVPRGPDGRAPLSRTALAAVRVGCGLAGSLSARAVPCGRAPPRPRVAAAGNIEKAAFCTLPPRRRRQRPAADGRCGKRAVASTCAGAMLLKWGQSTLAFFPMQNTHSGVCGRGILTRHWAFDGSEARQILGGSMHTAQMCHISLHRGADTVRSRYKRIVYKRIWVASFPFQSVWVTFSSY